MYVCCRENLVTSCSSDQVRIEVVYSFANSMQFSGNQWNIYSQSANKNLLWGPRHTQVCVPLFFVPYWHCPCWVQVPHCVPWGDRLGCCRTWRWHTQFCLLLFTPSGLSTMLHISVFLSKLMPSLIWKYLGNFPSLFNPANYCFLF